MKHCVHCHADIKGDWETCPLCGNKLEQREGRAPVSNPYPDVPLRFNKQRVTRWLVAVSLLVIFLYFVVDFFFVFQTGIGRLVLFGIMSMWLVVLIILRKKRNIAKGILYLLISLSLLMLYLDNLQGGIGWSITYAIPIICSASLVAMFIASRIVRLSVGDYVLYLLLAALLGFVPAVFLFIGWTSSPIPAWISIGFSFLMLVYVSIRHGEEIQTQLRKRLDV